MFAPVNNQPNPNGNQQQNLPKCDQFFRGIPFVSLVLYVVLVILWFIDTFFGIGNQYLTNTYQLTIQSYQIWRLFTSGFFQSSLLIVMFMILNFQTFLPNLECKKGSTYLIVDLIVRNIKVQSLVLAIQFILDILNIESKYIAIQSGIVGLWFNYMVIFCWSNPKQMKFCCLNWKFNRKFYPFIFASIISLLYFQIRIDMITGLALGLVQVTIFKNTKDLLWLKHYLAFDNLLSKLGLSKFSNWSVLQPSQYGQKQCTYNVYSNLESQQISSLLNTSNDRIDQVSTNQSDKRSSKNSDAFANLKGVRIGDY